MALVGFFENMWVMMNIQLGNVVVIVTVADAMIEVVIVVVVVLILLLMEMTIMTLSWRLKTMMKGTSSLAPALHREQSG